MAVSPHAALLQETDLNQHTTLQDCDWRLVYDAGMFGFAPSFAVSPADAFFAIGGLRGKLLVFDTVVSVVQIMEMDLHTALPAFEDGRLSPPPDDAHITSLAWSCNNRLVGVVLACHRFVVVCVSTRAIVASCMLPTTVVEVHPHPFNATTWLLVTNNNTPPMLVELGCGLQADGVPPPDFPEQQPAPVPPPAGAVTASAAVINGELMQVSIRCMPLLQDYDPNAPAAVEVAGEADSGVPERPVDSEPAAELPPVAAAVAAAHCASSASPASANGVAAGDTAAAGAPVVVELGDGEVGGGGAAGGGDGDGGGGGAAAAAAAGAGAGAGAGAANPSGVAAALAGGAAGGGGGSELDAVVPAAALAVFAACTVAGVAVASSVAAAGATTDAAVASTVAGAPTASVGASYAPGADVATSGTGAPDASPAAALHNTDGDAVATPVAATGVDPPPAATASPDGPVQPDNNNNDSDNAKDNDDDDDDEGDDSDEVRAAAIAADFAEDDGPPSTRSVATFFNKAELQTLRRRTQGLRYAFLHKLLASKLADGSAPEATQADVRMLIRELKVQPPRKRQRSQASARKRRRRAGGSSGGRDKRSNTGAGGDVGTPSAGSGDSDGDRPRPRLLYSAAWTPDGHYVLLFTSGAQLVKVRAHDLTVVQAQLLATAPTATPAVCLCPSRDLVLLPSRMCIACATLSTLELLPMLFKEPVDMSSFVSMTVSHDSRTLAAVPSVRSSPAKQLVWFSLDDTKDLAVKMGPEGGIQEVTWAHTKPRVFISTDHGRVYVLQRSVLTAFAGAMYPPGYALLLNNDWAPEREDEFDVMDEFGVAVNPPALPSAELVVPPAPGSTRVDVFGAAGLPPSTKPSAAGSHAPAAMAPMKLDRFAAQPLLTVLDAEVLPQEPRQRGRRRNRRKHRKAAGADGDDAAGAGVGAGAGAGNGV